MAAHTSSDPGPRDEETVLDEPWESLPVASWTPKGGATLSFPLALSRQSGGNRLVKRARPYRAGVKIDSTGRKEKTWTLNVLFSNSTDEPGLDPNTPLYPDVLNAIVDSFDLQETGDLVVPTRGKFRCRADTYEITESATDLRNSAEVQFVFVEDNEDSVDARAISTPTVKGSGKQIAAAAQFDAQQSGLWNVSVTGILDAMNELQGVVNTPGSVIDDTLATAAVLRRNVDRLVSSNSDPNQESRSTFTDPSSSRLTRRLNRMTDMASAAQQESAATAQSKVTSMTFSVRQSIFDIAAGLKPPQDPVALMELNQYRIEDPLSIDPGTVVLVFAA